MKNIYIIGGGTFNHVRSHLSLAAPAFGETAHKLTQLIREEIISHGMERQYDLKLVYTKMADPRNSNLVTNEDVEAYLDTLIADPKTKAIIFNVALTDFEGSIGDIPSGKYAERLKTVEGNKEMTLVPSPKLISKIRATRKDIFVVGFKTTTGQDSDYQYKVGLELLKKNSINLVLANDTKTRNNMIIVPEEARYSETTEREDVLKFLAKMTIARMGNTFTRSTVVEGEPVNWNSEAVPENLRTVVNHCIAEGAYKEFLGKTVGHFAVKVNDGEILTSIRKTNFNNLDNIGLVRVESKNKDEVIAHGQRPSVGGQSQRIIFEEHPETDCIAHFHCPVKEESKGFIPVKPQWQNECGSHECGQNTSNGLKEVDLGDGDKLKVVYLDEHGPNIVFSKNTPAAKVINFIDAHFDLSQKTGGLIQ